ncbi:MAG: NADP oxidoreductase [Gammaproteobacteria bacterium]|nr:NADP oxidoreductase [Gammaproteobacteria bacterium]
MSQLGTEAVPLRVAVVGAGPSGFYATEALLKSEIAAQVDLIERLPSPYGLVRSGVAPDHPKLKQSIEVYKKVAALEGFRFFGNVTVGKDVTPQELRDIYHAVIYTCGAETDRRLGIEGEDLAGSHTATEFVGWYNGHPDYRDREFDFSHETAVIIGQGNVAADVARILSKSVDELKHTDISQHALDALAESQIKTIAVVGRRGPAQAKFTTKELREFLELENCQAAIASEELALNEASQTEVADKKAGVVAAKNMAVFEKMAENAEHDKARTCRMMFCRSPIRIEGNGRIERVVLERNELSGEPFSQRASGTGETETLECGLLFRSIGYRGVPIEGVPFHDSWGVFPNQEGRITDGPDGTVVPGIYTAGWIKRGPSGIIGTNRACAVQTIESLMGDLNNLSADRAGTDALAELLQERGVRSIDFPEWQRIDAEEVSRGEPKGKPREKFTRREEMLQILG